MYFFILTEMFLWFFSVSILKNVSLFFSQRLQPLPGSQRLQVELQRIGLFQPLQFPREVQHVDTHFHVFLNYLFFSIYLTFRSYMLLIYTDKPNGKKWELNRKTQNLFRFCLQRMMWTWLRSFHSIDYISPTLVTHGSCFLIALNTFVLTRPLSSLSSISLCCSGFLSVVRLNIAQPAGC